jgi:hypothetical protein
MDYWRSKSFSGGRPIHRSRRHSLSAKVIIHKEIKRGKCVVFIRDSARIIAAATTSYTDFIQ